MSVKYLSTPTSSFCNSQCNEWSVIANCLPHVTSQCADQKRSIHMVYLPKQRLRTSDISMGAGEGMIKNTIACVIVVESWLESIARRGGSGRTPALAAPPPRAHYARDCRPLLSLSLGLSILKIGTYLIKGCKNNRVKLPKLLWCTAIVYEISNNASTSLVTKFKLMFLLFTCRYACNAFTYLYTFAPFLTSRRQRSQPFTV